MYASGALYNPDIFNEHKNLLTGRTANEPDKNALAKIIRRHIELARIHGPEKRAFVKTRSLIPRYVRAFPGAASLRGRLCEVPDWDALNELLYDFFRGAPEEREERTG